MEAPKPARLDALTGLRCFAALNIVFFHFSNPDWFGPLAPVVNAGYLSVSFFIMLSGFVLAYNYAGRAREGKLDKVRFWKARFTRLYPVYLLSLLMAWQLLPGEYKAHTNGMFWLGILLTPLLLQGWVPELATFWSTPDWTMSAEAFFYVLFPWIAALRKPLRLRGHLGRLSLIWAVGLIPGALYAWFNPDGIAQVDRFSYGVWLQALKFTPLPHLASFVFGVLLASLDEEIPREGLLRLGLGLLGFAGIYSVLVQGPRVPYALIHDGLLMPLFGCLILGLAGTNLLSRVLSFRPFVFVGESSYCLYLLHFNLWNILHSSGLLPALGLSRFDPWLSYAILVALGLATLHLVEKPAQKLLRRWMGA
ncbi:acyltransferase family protein [Acidicapsa ligni]|uniref:acyltransferase family protein n=1 Tax=Acidicapsa ligni TaxID=542300 RepID=UPI0021DF6C22|nr:acyltransferase [Acidicapsa ligni]